MAIAIKHKEVNEPLLRDFYIGIFTRYYQNIEDFLPVIRNEVSEKPLGEKFVKSDIYVTLDYLYKRWHPIYERMFPASQNRSDHSDKRAKV
jgi:hypothetical protein